ncbi:MAG: penicillin-binding protein activator LpoB [Proteobacteria bacterium]|nr:penicillin-binding protein activator LpoB [Pseudomonadota bacterium]MBU1640442.1 penicillin-binding protein activator LpoB [Pseudomonadota bacterium]
MKRIFVVLLLLSLSASGCAMRGGLESFSRENIDIGFVRSIAVLPLENNSKDEYAPERVRNLVMTQVLGRGLFDVIDKGVVDSLLHEEAIDPGKPLDRQALRRIGQRLNIQAVMLGTIDLADEGRKGAVVYPELSVTMRLLEVESGLVIWQASGHESGDSAWRRLFGLASVGPFELTLALVDKILSTIPH